jgi:hypothetical protein
MPGKLTAINQRLPRKVTRDLSVGKVKLWRNGMFVLFCFSTRGRQEEGGEQKGQTYYGILLTSSNRNFFANPIQLTIGCKIIQQKGI